MDMIDLARTIATRYGELPLVEAVALGGSLASGAADQGSDIDLYVYSHDNIPIEDRARIATTGARAMEIDNQFWEPGDEWIDGLDDLLRSERLLEEDERLSATH